MSYIPIVFTHRSVKAGIAAPSRAMKRAEELGLGRVFFSGISSELEIERASYFHRGVTPVYGECFSVYGGAKVSPAASFIDVYLFSRSPAGHLSLRELVSLSDRTFGGRTFGGIRFDELKHHLTDIGCVILPVEDFSDTQMSLISRLASEIPDNIWYGLFRYDRQRCPREMPSEDSIRCMASLDIRPFAYNQVCRVLDADILAQRMYIYDQQCRGNDDCVPASIGDSYLKSGEEMEALFPDNAEALENSFKAAAGVRPYRLSDVGDGDNAVDKIYSHILCEDIREAACVQYGNHIPSDVTQRLDVELAGFNSPGVAVAVEAFRKSFAGAGKAGFVATTGSTPSSMVLNVLGCNPTDPHRSGLLSELFASYSSRPDKLTMVTECDSALLVGSAMRCLGRNHTARVVSYRGVNRKRLALECHSIDPSLSDEDGKLLLEHLIKGSELPEHIRVYADAISLLDGCAAGWFVRTDKFITSSMDIWSSTPVFYDDATDSFVSIMYDTELHCTGITEICVRQHESMELIGRVLSCIRKRTGEVPDLSGIPMDETGVFDLICEGDAEGVHLFSTLARMGLRSSIAPRTIEELAAFFAVTDVRRKPLLKRYCRNRECGCAPTGTVIDAILEETDGTMIYYEQLMMALHRCAGYDLAETPAVIDRLLFKNKPDAALIGIEFRGNPDFRISHPDIVESISEYIAEYGRMFSTRSTSIADAEMSYRMAWLKLHYPDDFDSALAGGRIPLEAMRPFCREGLCDSPGQSFLCNPFLMGDYVCAGDGCFLLKVHRSLVKSSPAVVRSEIPCSPSVDLPVTKDMLGQLDAAVKEAARDETLCGDMAVAVEWPGGCAYFRYRFFSRILDAMNLLGSSSARMIAIGSHSKAVVRFEGVDAEMIVMPAPRAGEGRCCPVIFKLHAC